MKLAEILSLAALVLVPGLGATGCSIEDPYTGAPFARTEKIETRRLRPTKEEQDLTPPPPYEQVLRAEQAEKARLEVPKDVHESSKFIEKTERETRIAKGPGFGPAHDPWMSYEEDRKRVLVREWADTGKPEPVVIEPKKERPYDDDPYAPAPKVGKKEPAPDAADAEKKGDDEKKPEGGEKKGE